MLRNQKIEVFLVVASLILGVAMFLNETILGICSDKLLLILDGIHLELIVSAVAIFLGIYIAVLSIITTSVLGISKDMLEKRKDKQLLQIVILGMVFNIFLVFLCVAFDLETVWYAVAVITLLLVSFVSFFKFTILLFLIFQANFEQMSKQITEKELEKEEVLTLLKKIEQALSKK